MMACTCNAADCGPGAGHESYCGKPEICSACESSDCSECEEWTEFRACCCGDLRMTETGIAEERLRAYDYEIWSRL